MQSFGALNIQSSHPNIGPAATEAGQKGSFSCPALECKMKLSLGSILIPFESFLQSFIQLLARIKSVVSKQKHS